MDATTELGVLGRCVRELQTLAGDPPAQQRVLRYLVDRFRPDMPFVPESVLARLPPLPSEVLDYDEDDE